MFRWFSNLWKAAFRQQPAEYPPLPPMEASAESRLFDGSKFIGGLPGSVSSGMVLDHATLRKNGRNAYHTSSQARSIVDRYADTVVHTGLRLECAPDAEVLGITQEQAEEWAAPVEAGFDLWARSKQSMRDGSMNLYQGQYLAEIYQQRDNDYFARFYYSRRKDLINPLQIGFIDPEQINGTGQTNTVGVQFDGDGIERDAAGREISYNVMVKKPNGQYESVTVPAKGSRSGRRIMIHGFRPEYFGQGRGYSRLASVLQECEALWGFEMSHIQKALNQSSIPIYVKPSQDAPASDAFESLRSRYGAGPQTSATSLGSSENPPNSEDGPASETVKYTPMPEATITKPGSVAVFSLNSGEDLRPFESTAPVEDYDKFVHAFTSYLSASLSMPIEVLLMKFGSNYSASRAALILFWRVAQIWRHEMEADFLNPVFEAWLSEEIAAGRVVAPGWTNPRLRAAWLKCTWIGSPMPNIDPMQTARADQLYASLGAQTLDRVARNLDGSSGKANRRKLAREYAELPDPPWQDQKVIGGTK
jgi:lambda family phage portal protein